MKSVVRRCSQGHHTWTLIERYYGSAFSPITLGSRLKKIRDLCEASNRHLVVLLINEQETDGHFKEIEKQYNEVVKSFCGRLGVKVVDPLPVFEESSNERPIFTLGSDHHWSSFAHEVAAKELMRFLMKENVLTEVSGPSHENNSLTKRQD